MTGARLLLLLSVFFGLSSAAWGEESGKWIVLERPAAGETVTIAVKPGVTLELTFAPHEAQWRLRNTGDDLFLSFDDGGLLVLQDLATEALQASVDFDIAGDTVLAKTAIALAATPDEPVAAAAGPSGSSGTESLNLRQLRHSGRDLLFPGETEQAGHPLYSYLLFSGANGGTRDERERFRAAIEAFIGEFRTADALEGSGAMRGEINIFYAPMKAIFEDTTPENMRLHFAQRSPDEQAALLLKLYDYARAEVLVDRMQLSGGGPYIVSVLRPLSLKPISKDEAFIVQDLSDVPPALVTLWVDEFKRQVVQEATESPERLRRFALQLRTQIAVLAEAFAITKSAVADMFEESSIGGGN